MKKQNNKPVSHYGNSNPWSKNKWKLEKPLGPNQWCILGNGNMYLGDGVKESLLAAELEYYKYQLSTLHLRRSAVAKVPTLEERAEAYFQTLPEKEHSTALMGLMVGFTRKELEEAEAVHQKKIDSLSDKSKDLKSTMKKRDSRIFHQAKIITEQRERIRQLEEQTQQREIIRERSITITERVRHFREE